MSFESIAQDRPGDGRRHLVGGAAARPRRPVRPEAKKAEESLGDQANDIGIGLAKDLFTTADGRRTLRTVFGTLLGKK